MMDMNEQQKEIVSNHQYKIVYYLVIQAHAINVDLHLS